MLTTAFLTAFMGCAFSFQEERPAPLQRLEEQRTSLETGVVTWSLQDNRSDTLRFYTSRFAGDDDLLVYHGDEEGVVMRGPRGEASVVDARKVRYTLISGEDSWQYTQGAHLARIRKRTPQRVGVFEMRSLGASENLPFFEIDEAIWRDALAQPRARTYQQRAEGGLSVVEARADKGQMTWWIDPERGWSPVRVTLARDGRIIRETRTTLRQYDGIWYPRVVAVFDRNYHDGREAVQVVEVLAARFNHPDDPPVLLPDHIGIEVGTTIFTRYPDGSEDLGMWDGDETISVEEFRQRTRTGELRPGPRFVVESRRGALQDENSGEKDESGSGRAVTAPANLSTWERYTRDFIKRYALDDEQTQKAWAILLDCQERAAPYRTALARLDHESRTGESRDAATQASARTAQKRDGLLQAIDAVFEKTLKPRLDRLPTRAQRAAAGETAIEQP